MKKNYSKWKNLGESEEESSYLLQEFMKGDYPKVREKIVIK